MRRLWLGLFLLSWLLLCLLFLGLFLLSLLLFILRSGFFRLLGEGFEVLKLMLVEMVFKVVRSQVRRWCWLHEVINWSRHLNRLFHVSKTRRESLQWIVVLDNLVLDMCVEWMMNGILNWCL